MEGLIIIILLLFPVGIFLLVAWFIRGTQGGLQQGTRSFFSGLGRAGGKSGSYLFANRAILGRVFKKLFSLLALILRLGGRKVQEKRALIAERQDSTHDIQDVIVNIENMLPRINESMFFVELQEIKKKYRFFTREYNFFRDSPLFKKRDAKRVHDLNSELTRLLAMAENIEESLNKLYLDQDDAAESKQFFFHEEE